jgi:transposase
MNEPKTKDGAATPPRKYVPEYTEAFRRDSVAAWRQSGQSVPKYAPQIGIHETTLYAWIREEDRPHGGGAKTPADVDSLQAENRQLRAECERLRTQRDILKKTLGILSEPAVSATKG